MRLRRPMTHDRLCLRGLRLLPRLPSHRASTLSGGSDGDRATAARAPPVAPSRSRSALFSRSRRCRLRAVGADRHLGGIQHGPAARLRGDRVGIGDRPAVSRPRRLPWAELLRRVFAQDVLQDACGGRCTVVAFVTDANLTPQPGTTPRSLEGMLWRRPHEPPRI